MSLGSIHTELETGKSARAIQGRGSKLDIAALGGLSLRFSGSSVELASRKAKALLAYLAFVPNGGVSREHLVGLLWSETDEERGRASLRQVIKALRTTFADIGFDGLTVGRNEISLDPSLFDIDVTSVFEAVDEIRVHPTLLDRERISDSFLSGYDDIDPSFRNWLRVQRENLSQRLTRGLEAILSGADDGHTVAKRQAAEALILLDPTHEEACRKLIRQHAEAGDTAAALEAYNRLWRLLDNEYDAEPSERTQELIAAVKLGEIRPANAVPLAPAARQAVDGLTAGQPRDRQAVEPEPLTRLTLLIGHFDLDGISSEQKHLCVGFRSELISTLVRYRVWSIVDVSRWTKDAEDRQPMQPRYLLHGQLYQDATNVYLVLELQEPGTGVLVWSDRFVLKLDNYFAAQQDIVRKIAYSLNVHISYERLRQISGQPDISLDIYDRWLRGQHFVLTWSPDLRRRAVEIFESIIVDSPQFAPAYSSLVSVLNSNHFVFPGVLRTTDVQREALRLAKKAVEIDPLDSRSQLHLAWSQAMNGEYGIAELGFELACKLNDNDPWTVASAAGGFAFCGRPDKGYELSRKGLELAISPVPMVWAYVGCVRYINGDDEGCIAASTQAEEDVVIMLAWKAAALHRTGQEDLARQEFQRLLRRVNGNWHGGGQPTAKSVIDWVVQCFPIRDTMLLEDVRERLDASAGLLS